MVDIDGHLHIIDGHHRTAAAKRTGTKVIVNVVAPSDLPKHHSNYNSIEDVLRDPPGPDRLKPPHRRRGR